MFIKLWTAYIVVSMWSSTVAVQEPSMYTHYPRCSNSFCFLDNVSVDASYAPPQSCSQSSKHLFPSEIVTNPLHVSFRFWGGLSLMSPNDNVFKARGKNLKCGVYCLKSVAYPVWKLQPSCLCVEFVRKSFVKNGKTIPCIVLITELGSGGPCVNVSDDP